MASSIELEHAVVGACLLDESIIPEVATILKPGDFFSPATGRAFECILALHNQEKAVDLLTVDNAIRALKASEPTAADLAKWADETAVAAHAADHAEAVRKHADARAMTRLCQDSLEKLSSMSDDPKRIAEHLAGQILQISSGSRREFVSLLHATVAAVKSIQRAATGERSLDAIPTGLAPLDYITGGIFRGQLIIPAGRPSMGKTALMMTIVKNAAQRGHLGAVVSCESPTNSIVLRLISGATGIENRDLRRGKLEDRHYPQIAHAAGILGDLPIYILDQEDSWEAIKAQLRAFKMKHPELALIGIDYVQLVSLNNREDRYKQLGQISRESKKLAVELDAGMLLLSQISRDVDRRQDKRATISDLRESGNLEQDADVIWFPFRPHYYDDDKPKDLAEINIAKNRDGATGVIELTFNEKTASFSDPPAPAPEQESFL